MQRLAGKNSLITGGGRGLGKAIALRFAAEGSSVAISFGESEAGAADTVRQAEAMGVGAFAVRAQLRDRKQVGKLSKTVLERFGRVDVLVNNAGLFSASPFLETTDEIWDQLLAVNLTAPFLCARALAPAMLAAGGGVIINIASGGGQQAWPGYISSPAYAASKAGLIMLSRRLALDLAPTVRVNCIAPGIIDSKPKPMSESARGRFSALTPLGSVGEPRDVASAAVFLASDEAAFMTGQTLNVDGGISI